LEEEMTYRLLYHPLVAEDIEGLPGNIKDRVRQAIEKRLLPDPARAGRPLRQSLAGHRKMRVGDLRIIYRVQDDRIVILKIGHRKDVYAKAGPRLSGFVKKPRKSMGASMDDSVRSEGYRELKTRALELGFDLFGVADVTGMRGDFLLEPETRERFGRAVSLGKRLSDAVLDDLRDHPTQLYFHHYRQMNFFLDRAAFLLADDTQKRGWASLAIAASQIVDWEGQRAHLSHKHVGAAPQTAPPRAPPRNP
jgi:addiction module RelE/StbE family toxin